MTKIFYGPSRGAADARAAIGIIRSIGVAMPFTINAVALTLFDDPGN